MNRSLLVRAFLASAALSAAVALSGCNTDGALPMSERAARPLSEKTVAEIESKNMDKESPILVRTFKEESELEVWKQDRTGRYALLKTYPICRWSGELGPKIKEGDRQAPEGFYNITPGQMNPNSQYYLSFDLGYPNAFDRAHGRTGSQLMVHGDCSSRGCYSMTDEQISEIYALGRDSFFGGQKSFQVQAYPFRMTPQNLAKHRTNPSMAFWKMLKKGYDHFEVSRLEPKVDFCEKRYVFGAEAPGGSNRPLSFSASAKCPVYEVPEDIANAVAEKERKDNIQTAELIRRGTPAAPIRTNADGGMHPVFVAAVKRNQIGVAPQEAFLVSTPPGTIPATVRPPRIPELADAPILAAHAPTEQPGAVTPAHMAIAEPAETSAKSTLAKPGNLLGSLFSWASGDKDKNSDSAKAAAVPAPKPKPAVRQAHAPSHASASRSAAASGAIRPKESVPEAPRASETKPRETVASASQSVWPAPPPVRAKPQPQTQAQAQPQAPATSAMNGAAPVVPAGNFDNRWSAFR